MREIPSLQILSLRSIGSHACSVEVTFAPASNGNLSVASRLLRSYHQRPVVGSESSKGSDQKLTKENDGPEEINESLCINQIPMTRTPCIGPGSSRRYNTNLVDLHHPIIATRVRNTDNSEMLVAQYGNPALDVLQSYIDALCELGRIDDGRLGRHFFDEFKANIVQGGANADTKAATNLPEAEVRIPKKRRRGRSATPVLITKPAQLGSLSLHNCVIGSDTLEAMEASGIGRFLAVLDLTGINGLNDDLCAKLLRQCPYLERLSLKNGRRLTCKCLLPLTGSSSLTSLDVGGCFNMVLPTFLDTILPQLSALTDLHASGLGWTDDYLGQLMSLSNPWIRLSLGFSSASTISPGITGPPLRQHLLVHASTLISLSLPFCESFVDNAVLGMLGRNLPYLQFMDLRGNPGLQTLTGWYDGRASADLPAQPLAVLGRYSSLTAASVEETKRIHPVETVDLVVVLDGEGMGLAIPFRNS